MKPSYPNKEARDLVRFAEQNNFTVSYGKHLKFRRGNILIVASLTPSCRYAYANAKRDLEKAIAATK